LLRGMQRQILRNLGQKRNPWRPTRILRKLEQSGRKIASGMEKQERNSKKAHVSTSACSQPKMRTPMQSLMGSEGSAE
jgi:hypothetical protein